MENLEDLVKNNKALSELLNENRITEFSDFGFVRKNPELKAHIEERYIKSFRSIFENARANNNEIKINALLRSIIFLATPNVKEELSKEFQPYLEDALQKLKSSKEIILKGDLSEEKEEELVEKMDSALSHAVMDSLNKFGETSRIQPLKDQIIEVCLDMCDYLEKFSPKKEPVKYAIYNVLMNNLVTVNDHGKWQQRYDSHNKEITKTRDGIETKYYVMIAVFVLFFVLRIILKMSR